MKKLLLAGGLSLALIWSCGSDNSAETKDQSQLGFINYSVAQDNDFTGLPALQSFVFASYQNYWIMFSGRTNGFHGFDTSATGSGDFPVSKANTNIYVYDTQQHQLYTMPIPFTGDQACVFMSTNLPHTQQGNTLYACGGYGPTTPSGPDANKTYNYFMKIDLPSFVQGVINNQPAGVVNSVAWGQSNYVANTGGELFLLPDHNFYLCVGHNFTGTYGDQQAIQRYQDKVNVFSLSESNNQLTINFIDSITDGLNDTLTQFHRRDLCVAPCIQQDGSTVGISIYGGVFRYTSGSPYNNNGLNWTNPIYINYNNTPKYFIETGANQYANIYSTAFCCMYDKNEKKMMTTFFGGLGNETGGYDSTANWTNLITTAERNYLGSGNGTTNFVTNLNRLPAYLGAESVFIPASGLPWYNEAYKIIDHTKLKPGTVIGYIYGGIISADAAGTVRPPSTSNVYAVTYNMNYPPATK